MQIHNVKRNTANAKARRVGRGGKRGKTSGRGMKGQKARAGRKLRPEMRDIIKKLPKLRGHGKNRARTVNASVLPSQVVNVSLLDAVFTDGDTVSPATLLEKRLVRRKGGKVPAVKILGTGMLAKKLIITHCTVSESARGKIEKAGGTVEDYE